MHGIVSVGSSSNGGILRIGLRKINLVVLTLGDGYTSESVLPDLLGVDVVVWDVISTQE